MKKAKKAKASKPKPVATSPIVVKRLADLERRVTRLEQGHSGDPAAHAALGAQPEGEPQTGEQQAAGETE